MSCSGPDGCLEWKLSLTRSRWQAWKLNPSFCLPGWSKQSIQWYGQSQASQGGKGRHGFLGQDTSGIAFSLVFRGSCCVNFPPLGQWGLHTFPWATSSLWAAEADLTRALVAAAMDLAASKICSSKSRVSSACYNQKKTASRAIHIPKGRFLLNDLLLGHLALPPCVDFYRQTTPRVERLQLAGCLSICCLPPPFSKR